MKKTNNLYMEIEMIIPYQALLDAIRHSLTTTDEVCGLIIKDDYLPCKNISDTPTNNFRIEPNKILQVGYENIDFIVHSHNNDNKPSESDIASQKNCGIPYIIINIKDKEVKDIICLKD